MILQSERYEIATVTTAKEALEKAKSDHFSLALLDIKLPDIDGTELLAQLQKMCPDMIEIMVTGYPSLKNAVAALNFGAASYLMKPVAPDELLKTIRDKLMDMTIRARKQIDLITSLQEFRMGYINRPKKLRDRLLRTVRL